MQKLRNSHIRENLVMGQIIIRESLEEVSDIPKIVYKYRNWTDENHQTLLTKQIVFMSAPTSFEDPVDCKLFKRYDLLTNDEIYDYYLKNSKTRNPTFSRQQHREFARGWAKKSLMRDKEQIKKMQQEDFIKFDERFGVLSLTANPSNYFMWDKYSENHRGFCVGFDAMKMFKRLGGGSKVIYYDILPEILPSDDFDTEWHKQIFSKERKWEFEQEYRTHMFYEEPITNKERQIIIPKDCFSEIIFGANMTLSFQNEIQAICLEQNLQISFLIEKLDMENKIVTIQPK